MFIKANVKPESRPPETAFVHRSSGAVPPAKTGEFALFWSPSMQLLPEPTQYLHHLTRISKSEGTWRNNAYALAYWHSYCAASQISWEVATIDDYLDYKDALSECISRQTGTLLTPGTIAARMMIVASYYEFAGERGWYKVGSRGIDIKGARTASDTSVESAPIGAGSAKLIPRRREAEFDISPFSIADLRRFLNVLGSSQCEDGGVPGRKYRNRLIVDWGWAVGLRVAEITRLNIHQFLSLTLKAQSPWEYTALSIIGKGSKKRSVSVPNWLISDTISYINEERKEAVTARGLKNGAPTNLFVAGSESTRAGKPIGVRRIEAIVTSACVASGLTKKVETWGHDGSRRVRAVAAHCVHDLRHTYAVLTYWAEVQLGNPEPWKKIQAQLGHSSLQTTKDTYLRFVDAHAEFQSASVRQLIDLPILLK